MVLQRSELEPTLFNMAVNNLEEKVKAETTSCPSLLPSFLHGKTLLFYSGSPVSSLFSSTKPFFSGQALPVTISCTS